MFKPFVSAKETLPEFTLRASLLGIILGLIFALGNAYLGLKIGTTVSASIPAAVISMAVLKAFFKNVSVLENNIVQTIASVGEGLASGIVFTVPALFLMGEKIDPTRICLLSFLGGVLGVLFMIPMRRYIIVKEHGTLPFPEGTACAEILKSGQKGSSKAFMAVSGILTGAFYKMCGSLFNLWNEVPSWPVPFFQKTEFSIDCTPSLLGVGYIVGPRITSYIVGGGAFGWWILIPLIQMFGTGTLPIYPAEIPVAQMSADDIWSSYIRYIGAGAVATGGILSLFKIGPLIWKTVHVGLSELFSNAHGENIPRTDRDISLKWLILGSLAIVLSLWLYPGLPMNLFTITLLVILGFFFVAVTSLTVGLLGSTSNPVSGMTLTTLLITCAVFAFLGWTERAYLIAALTMAVAVNVAICLAGTTSQDLKTGFLLGATPRLQQIAEIIGLILPSLALGGAIFLLNEAYGFGSKEMPAPQGTLMVLVAKGVISGDIPLTLISIGIVIGLVLELIGIPILPFAVGLYLPLSLSTPMVLGGLASIITTYYSRKTVDKNSLEERRERGILAASGLVAGDACTGVAIALFAVLKWIDPTKAPYFSDRVSLSVFFILTGALIWLVLKPPRFLMKKT